MRMDSTFPLCVHFTRVHTCCVYMVLFSMEVSKIKVGCS